MWLCCSCNTKWKAVAKAGVQGCLFRGVVVLFFSDPYSFGTSSSMMRTLLCASSMAGVRTAHHGLSASAESQDEVSAAPTAQSGGKPILRLGVVSDIQVKIIIG